MKFTIITAKNNENNLQLRDITSEIFSRSISVVTIRHFHNMNFSSLIDYDESTPVIVNKFKLHHVIEGTNLSTFTRKMYLVLDIEYSYVKVKRDMRAQENSINITSFPHDVCKLVHLHQTRSMWLLSNKMLCLKTCRPSFVPINHYGNKNFGSNG